MLSKASFVPSNVFDEDEIDEAVKFQVAADTPSSVADLRLAVCATPSIEVSDRVLDDGWAALQDDLAAARRRDGGFSQMDAEIEQLRGRCAELEESVRAEREGAEQLRRQLRSATERVAAAEVRAGELEARAADLNKELERVHADLGAERRFGSTERPACSCACRCT